MENSSKKVLVVEDDTSLLNMLTDKLSLLGFHALKADDGRKAIDIVLREQPDLIFLDLLIPEVDGYQVLQTVRTHGDPKVSSTPVIVLSNLWSDKDILRAKSLRVSEYYVKAQTDLEEVFKKAQILLGKSL